MDNPAQRAKYINVFPNYTNKLVLTFQLKNCFRRLSPIFWEVNKNPPDENIKTYILTEMTKTRESCTQVIQILLESKVAQNIAIAESLQLFNSSPGRIIFDDESYIPVTPVLSKEVKLPNTRNYQMTKNPRGKAIIINIVQNEVQREAQRFLHIFNQMKFEPKMPLCLTTAEIKEYLKKVSEDLRDEPQKFMDEALIVMIISNGFKEMLAGKNHPSCGGKDQTDIVHISEIVNIFAKFVDMIKIFFFTYNRTIKEDISSEKYWLENSPSTYVFYSSSEGEETNHDSFYTVPGRKLSETFAQYANYFSLTELINSTNQALSSEYQVDSMDRIKSRGYFALENKQKAITHNLYFNPGWCESDSNSSVKHNIQDFEFHSKIGEGGYGIVNKYKCLSDQKFYAIKEIVLEQIPHDKFIREFLREIDNMGKIKSHFVVQYHQNWIENKYLFIQMELCSEDLRKTLKDKLKVFERSEKQAMNSVEYFISCEIFRQITEALNYLHSLKPLPLIHRDVKPENILVGIHGNRSICKLADFGLSKFIEDKSGFHTKWVGDPRYQAHEVKIGEKYDTKADVFSLGLVALELFSMKSSKQINNDLYKSSVFGVKIDEVLRTIQLKLAFITKDDRISAKELLELLQSLTIDRDTMIDSMSGCDKNYDYFFYKCQKESDFFYGILKQ